MTTSELINKAKEIRIDIVKSLAAAGSGHTGGSLGLTDIFTCLYFEFMNHDPSNPDWDKRDRLVLSNGHVAPVLYTTLAHCGYFPVSELTSLRKLGSRLQGHPGKDHGLPGLELSSGSLGHGLSIGTGMALADKTDKKKRKVIVVLGDGELQEGSVWEAAMSAAFYKLDNLIAIVDRNNVQIDGKTSEVMEIEPLEDKWKAFGWKVFKCNGHNMVNILDALENASGTENKPAVIIAKTIMGKGIKQIEGDYTWHGKAPDTAQAKVFISELMQS